jgi:hypothetical protein
LRQRGVLSIPQWSHLMPLSCFATRGFLDIGGDRGASLVVSSDDDVVYEPLNVGRACWKGRIDPGMWRSYAGLRGNSGALSACGEAGISIDRWIGSGCSSKAGYGKSPNVSNGLKKNAGSCLISVKADGANSDPSKKGGLLVMRNASTYGIALSPANDEAGYERDEESDDCESSKLNCVVGVDRDEVGESGV